MYGRLLNAYVATVREMWGPAQQLSLHVARRLAYGSVYDMLMRHDLMRHEMIGTRTHYWAVHRVVPRALVRRAGVGHVVVVEEECAAGEEGGKQMELVIKSGLHCGPEPEVYFLAGHAPGREDAGGTR